jgi:hypothetical protein
MYFLFSLFSDRGRPFQFVAVDAERTGKFCWGARFRAFKKCFEEEREMLNKKLVLGSLAGASLLVGAALLLPGTAAAGLMTGVCSGCHTMHNSQDGAIMFDDGGAKILGDAAFGQLLAFDGCTGCHAREANAADGRAASNPKSPQVGAAASATINAGGYFDNASADNMMHNVAGITGAEGTLATSPGGTHVSAAFTCTNCHADAQGGHHTYGAVDAARTGGAADSYRMLRSTGVTPAGVVGTGDINYGNVSVSTQLNTYDSATMNAFCADCHGSFHGPAAQGGGTGLWVRHPTDVDATTYVTAGVVGASYAGNTQTIPSDAADMVMCISCHRPHGSGVADLLRFTYDATTNAAGDTKTSIGCETCHGTK